MSDLQVGHLWGWAMSVGLGLDAVRYGCLLFEWLAIVLSTPYIGGTISTVACGPIAVLLVR